MISLYRYLLEFTIDYLEELLILIGFILFIAFGFMIAVKLGVLFTSISFFIGSYLVVKFKKRLSERGGD